MAEITLANYTGYIFLEIIKARQMADEYSRQLAETYAKDKILQYFSVPRFRVPKMELTIPVLISGARFEQVIRFNMSAEKFGAYISGLINEVISSVNMSNIQIFKPRLVQRPIVINPVAVDPRIEIEDRNTIEQLVSEFWDRLQNNPDPSQPNNIVRDMWTRIFEKALIEQQLEEAYKENNHSNELFQNSLGNLLNMVITNTVVDSTKVQSLLVNPETNVVKNSSSETSVFTIRADLHEEGFYIREIKDESTGQIQPIVEFE